MHYLQFYMLYRIIPCLVVLHVVLFHSPRIGAVRYESVMALREQLDRLGKMKGIAQDEKGGICTVALSVSL